MPATRPLTFGRYDRAAFVTFAAYAAASVVVPVSLVELSRELGFSLAEGGMSAGGTLHLGRTVSMVAAMLLAGFVAGRWGNRPTLGWSVLLMALGMSLCAIAPSYGLLLFALLLAGLGEGVIEGLGTPFVQALHPRESGRYINFTHGFWSLGVLITVLGSGLLLSLDVSWRLIVGVVAGAGFLAGCLILLPAPVGQAPYPDTATRVPWRRVRDRASAIVRTPRFWLYYAAMFLAGGGEFCLTFWSASHIHLHYGGSAWTGGVGVALFATGMLLGRTGWGYLIEQRGLRRLIVLSALGGTVLCALLPGAGSLGFFLVLLFGAGVATAPFWPSIQSYATDRLPDVDSDMLLILLSCAGVPGCGFFTFLMGWLGDRAGNLSAAFYLVPAAYAALGLLIAFDSATAKAKT